MKTKRIQLNYAFMHDLIVVRMTTTTYFAEIYSKSAFFKEFDLISNQTQSILPEKWTVVGCYVRDG